MFSVVISVSRKTKELFYFKVSRVCLYPSVASPNPIPQRTFSFFRKNKKKNKIIYIYEGEGGGGLANAAANVFPKYN